MSLIGIGSLESADAIDGLATIANVRDIIATVKTKLLFDLMFFVKPT